MDQARHTRHNMFRMACASEVKLVIQADGQTDRQTDRQTDKTHYTCWPPRHGQSIHAGVIRAHWEARLTFVGGILDLGGHSGAAIDHRLAQANKTYHKWKPMFKARLVDVKVKLDLATKTILPCLLWLGQTWTPTKTQSQKMESWAARLFARIAGLRQKSGQHIGDYWREMHRAGHGLLAVTGGSIEARRRQLLHRFAGQAARERCGKVWEALRTRCLSWWRWQQGIPNGIRHPRRFKLTRWEGQLADYYGDAAAIDMRGNADWKGAAQDADAWATSEDAFRRHTE